MIFRRKHFIILGILLLIPAGWMVANPPGRFGWCSYGYSTFSCWPKPISDFQVRADGTTRTISKTHDLTIDHLQWLLESQPEVLIVSLGWDGVVRPEEAIKARKGCEIHLLKNKEAIELYNRLKREGRRVAIHYHSTC